MLGRRLLLIAAFFAGRLPKAAQPNWVQRAWRSGHPGT